jgi:predicted nucleic acid-binding protein
VFLDTNILLRANVEEAPFRIECLTAIKRLRATHAELWIIRRVLREFMAVLTRPQRFVDPPPVNVITERVRYFETHFWIADEGSLVTEKLITLLETIPLGGKQVHDANIVATMLVYGMGHLLTLNTADFTRFSTLISLLSLSTLEPWLSNE